MAWPRDCASFILLCSIGCSPETAQPRAIPCSQAVSGVISDVKTGLRVRRPISPSRIPNEMAAKSLNNMRGLRTWAVCCFRGLEAIKQASNYKKERPSTTENHSKALYDDVWPDYLRLKFHTVSAYNLRSLEAPKLAIPTESGTFQDSAARLFSMLADRKEKADDWFLLLLLLSFLTTLFFNCTYFYQTFSTYP